MKLLIVDDQPARYSRLVDAMKEVGVSRDDIDFASSSSVARDRLVVTRYDLVVLDILLPLWPEGEPDVQHSLDLLLEIHETTEFLKPRRILGISVDLLLAKDTAEKLVEWTWTVIEYSESSDEWLNRIMNCIRYIIGETEQEARGEVQFGVDLAIVCALAEPELAAVLELPWAWSSSRPINDLIFVHDGKLTSNGQQFSVCAMAATRVGMVSTAVIASTAISILRPRLIAMCGICAGVRGRVKLGDVLFADPSWDFQSGKRVRKDGIARFAFAPHQLHPPELVRSHVDQIRQDDAALRRIDSSYSGDVPNPLRIVMGPVATGSPVVADGQVVEEIRAQNREVVGIEMEIFGMYAAASGASSPRPNPFALKGVCDFADEEKNDDYQAYAAYASANVLRLLMERFAARLLV